uniref:Truncated PGN n=1 Tax=Glycine max TaxID=3847 RepID=Q2KMJ5_SOYBN|nr:truncated PGN [Glycine max]
MKFLFAVLAIFVVALPCAWTKLELDAGPSFNVIDYGATGNGQTDDSQAFLKAWKDACNASYGTATLLIPKEKTFMLQPVLFRGPCKPPTVHIKPFEEDGVLLLMLKRVAAALRSKCVAVWAKLAAGFEKKWSSREPSLPQTRLRLGNCQKVQGWHGFVLGT